MALVTPGPVGLTRGSDHWRCPLTEGKGKSLGT